MRYPPLVPPRLCHTHVKVTLTGGLTMSGGIETLCTVFTKCNLTFATKQRFTSEKRIVTIAGTALFSGDPFPSVENPTGELVTVKNNCLETERGELLETENGNLFSVETGYVFPPLETEACAPLKTESGETLTAETGDAADEALFGKVYRIFRAIKERNPDGTVNYTRLELV